MPQVRSKSFGEAPDGSSLQLFSLQNRHDSSVEVTNIGASVVAVRMPDRHGGLDDVVLGYDCGEEYIADSHYMGAVVGRYANRIRCGQFGLGHTRLQLTRNSNGHHLHGGTCGISKRVWQGQDCSTTNSCRVLFTHVSPADDQGYPGEVKLQVLYTLDDRNRLTVTYEASSSADTIINLTQHSYFNLRGHDAGSIDEQELRINSDRFCVIDREQLPTGEIRPVAGTAMDFRTHVPVGKHLLRHLGEQLNHGNGYDHTWVLPEDDSGSLIEAAQLYCKRSGRRLTVLTDQPGVHFYSGNFLDGARRGKGGSQYRQRAGLCLETQHFPDSPNHPNFPSTVLLAGEQYSSTTVFAFSAA